MANRLGSTASPRSCSPPAVAPLRRAGGRTQGHGAARAVPQTEHATLAQGLVGCRRGCPRALRGASHQTPTRADSVAPIRCPTDQPGKENPGKMEKSPQLSQKAPAHTLNAEESRLPRSGRFPTAPLRRRAAAPARAACPLRRPRLFPPTQQCQPGLTREDSALSLGFYYIISATTGSRRKGSINILVEKTASVSGGSSPAFTLNALGLCDPTQR